MADSLKGDIRPGAVIDTKYRITKKIGEGSFGEIFAAISLPAPNNPAPPEVAIKFEKIFTGKKLLESESQTLSVLNGLYIHTLFLPLLFCRSPLLQGLPIRCIW